MPRMSCAHKMSANKKIERVDTLMTFLKSATQQQMSAKLHDVWAAPQATITEARLLLTLGANPESLYKDDYGHKTLMDRVDSGTVCDKCVVKFNDFLEYAGVIYEEMCEQTPINIVRGRKCTSGLLPLCMDGGGMRGLVSVVCLLFASRRILGDETLVNYFDWLIGTRIYWCDLLQRNPSMFGKHACSFLFSTGSMLALSTANGRTLSECFFLYWNMKRQIFLEGSTMSRLLGDQVSVQTRNIEKVLSDCFPTETFQQCDRRLTVPALDISMAPARLHIFRYGETHLIVKMGGNLSDQVVRKKPIVRPGE
ncbi:phospholipase, patatin family [Ancylostoma duodenale]|uniref:Phospholipase, patatin family n=1 Tax=Ancylostoma duodenale TaxID=51022 RepID=A0A0C2DZC3_9BILA|nr:phospholipase, patatin family [Ancylostoma duodenale]